MCFIADQTKLQPHHDCQKYTRCVSSRFFFKIYRIFWRMYDDSSGLHHHPKFTFSVVEVKVFPGWLFIVGVREFCSFAREKFVVKQFAT